MDCYVHGYGQSTDLKKIICPNNHAQWCIIINRGVIRRDWLAIFRIKIAARGHKIDCTSSLSLTVTRLDCYAQDQGHNIGQIKCMNKLLPWPGTLQTNLFTKLVIMYHQTKFGYEKISSSGSIFKTVIFWYMSHQFGLDLEDTKTIFCISLWLSMMQHHTMFGYEMSSVSGYHLDKHSLKL